MKRNFIAAGLTCAACLYGSPPIKTSLLTTVPGCQDPKEVAIVFKVEKAVDFTAEAQARMVGIWKWFDAASQANSAELFSFRVQAVDEPAKTIPVAHLKLLGGSTEDWTPNPRHADAPFRPPRELKACLFLRQRLPAGSLDAKLAFLSPPDPKLPVLPTDLSVAAANASLAGPPLPNAVGPSTAAAKSFVRELDLSGGLLSSVQSTAANGVSTRSRITKATGDLFLSPIPALRKIRPKIGNNFVTYFTPIAIEAHASNQPITKDTLSQNRIVAGPEFEIRWYAHNKADAVTGNLLRLILSAKSTSDRDFKLIEPRFAAEFRPIWGKANEPVVDPKWLKGTGHRRTVSEKFGRTFSPFAGFEEGRSHLRGIPVTAATPLGGFTRGYFGSDLGVDFNGRVSLTTTQTMYVRGEVQNDWVHYMKNGAQWTFLAAPGFASALYVSFEKGRLPPFRSTVNAVTFGVRVQSSNWNLGAPR